MGYLYSNHHTFGMCKPRSPAREYQIFLEKDVGVLSGYSRNIMKWEVPLSCKFFLSHPWTCCSFTSEMRGVMWAGVWQWRCYNGEGIVRGLWCQLGEGWALTTIHQNARSSFQDVLKGNALSWKHDLESITQLDSDFSFLNLQTEHLLYAKSRSSYRHFLNPHPVR